MKSRKILRLRRAAAVNVKSAVHSVAQKAGRTDSRLPRQGPEPDKSRGGIRTLHPMNSSILIGEPAMADLCGRNLHGGLSFATLPPPFHINIKL